jgi:hypothetical protein
LNICPRSSRGRRALARRTVPNANKALDLKIALSDL